MNDIFNFIKINDDDDKIIIFISEISEYKKNKQLYNLGNKFYNHLIKKNLINSDSIIMISYIKHFSKSIKNMIITKNKDEELKLDLDPSTIIADYILTSKTKNVYDNFLIIEQNNELTMHYIKKKFSLKKHLQFYC